MATPKQSLKFDWERLIHRVQHLKPMTKLVAFAMAHYASPDGTSIRPGNERLARELCIGEQTVRNHLKILRDAGYLIRTSEHKQSAWRGYADEYVLAIPEDWDADWRQLLDPDGHRYLRTESPVPA